MKPYIKYLRAAAPDGSLHPYGVVVIDEQGRFGFALCNPKDHFEYKRARQIAFGRAACGRQKGFPVPVGMGEVLGAARDEALEWWEAQKAKETSPSNSG